MKTIFLTGATGYIGGKLLPLLEKAGYHVRCYVREPRFLLLPKNSQTEVIKGDVLDKKVLSEALKGVDVAFYFIHSMSADQDFIQKDRDAAIAFATCCSEAKVKRIIYLGGLGDSNQTLSPHLKSRQEVGACLKEYAKGVQVIEFRASIVIGAGSLSFEMIRALCERLPVMITPKWVWNLAQPIGIDDVLKYLLKGIEVDVPSSCVFEIGGKDQMSYGDLMKEYIRQRGLHRLIIPVPFLTLHLSSLWLGLITPVYAKVGKKLIDSIRIPTLVKDHRAEELLQVKPEGIQESMRKALADQHITLPETHGGEAIPLGGRPPDWEEIQYGRRLSNTQIRLVDLTPEEAFTPIRRIGGKTGWYYWNFLWEIRGYLDLLVGGVGMRRGRRDEDEVKVDDYIDFWHVEAFEENHFIRLRAEMRVPGRAWLQFLVEPEGKGSKITQTAYFDPAGISGVLYWYSLYPFHCFIFKGMLNRIIAAGEEIKNEKAKKLE